MPQSLDDDQDGWWRERLEEEKRDEGFDETIEELHEAHANLIGNLTLARRTRNVLYANKSYPEKIALINEELPIRLNAELGVAPYENWGIKEIRMRSRSLTQLACAIWDGPSGR